MCILNNEIQIFFFVNTLILIIIVLEDLYNDDQSVLMLLVIIIQLYLFIMASCREIKNYEVVFSYFFANTLLCKGNYASISRSVLDRSFRQLHIM